MQRKFTRPSRWKFILRIHRRSLIIYQRSKKWGVLVCAYTDCAVYYIHELSKSALASQSYKGHFLWSHITTKFIKQRIYSCVFTWIDDRIAGYDLESKLVSQGAQNNFFDISFLSFNLTLIAG